MSISMEIIETYSLGGQPKIYNYTGKDITISHLYRV